MPTFEDANGVSWDIRTTSAQIGTQPPIERFTAAVREDSPRDYSANQFSLDDEETTPAGTFVTWPANGNPILRGRGTGEDAIKSFASRNTTRVALRVGGSADKKSNIPWWAWLALFYGGYRVIKKATGGKRYAG